MSGRDLIDRAVGLSGIGSFALNRGTDKLRILCYHGIWSAPGPHFGNKLFMSPAKFEARVALMKKLGLEVLGMREAMRLMREKRLPPKATVITIDDGWASTFTHMLPVLERFGYPATVYVQTERVELQAPVADVALRYGLENSTEESVSLAELEPLAERIARPLPLRSAADKAAAFEALESIFSRTPMIRHRDLLAAVFSRLNVDMTPLARCKAFDLTDEASLVEADRKGFEIALHTHTHSLGDFSAERISSEIELNRASLSRILSRPAHQFNHFCWPSGDYTPQAISRLGATGVDVATTCDLDLAGGNAHPLALPRILDGQATSEEAFLTSVSGLQTWISRVGSLVRS